MPVNQGVRAATSQPNKIGPATPDSKSLTAYGGLLKEIAKSLVLAFPEES
jgi:hypothetical protein